MRPALFRNSAPAPPARALVSAVTSALAFAACSADPPAGNNSRGPAAPVSQSPNVPFAPGTPPGAGGTGGASTPPPPASGGAPADAAAMPPSSMDAGPTPQADAGPEPLPFCDPDSDAGTTSATQGTCIAIGDFRVQYKAGDAMAADNAVKPHLNLINDGDQPVSLSELTIRYWFTREGGQAQEFHCDYAQIGCGQVQGAFVATTGQGADHYLELSFAGGSLAPGAQTGEIQLRFNKVDWSPYDESDDYSHDSSHTGFADAPQVTLYRQGALAWGAEPPL